MCACSEPPKLESARAPPPRMREWLTPIKHAPPHIRYHIEFGVSTSSGIGKPPNLITLEPRPLERAWLTPKTRGLPICDTRPKLVVI